MDQHRSVLASHELEPVYNEKSKILILGSFPSVKSRESNFYYGHPRNRFWDVLSYVYLGQNNASFQSVADKKQFLYDHEIALWDVIDSCRITGSSDSSIKEVIPVDIIRILHACKISAIVTNGQTANRLYKQHLLATAAMDAILLPSTSPANAAFSLERLQEVWAEAIHTVIAK
ncbi:MAG: DNA-deoxyinosine glycosylase [Lachnospiraceae bacterium]